MRLPAVALDHVGLASVDPPLLALALGFDPQAGQAMPSGVVISRFGPSRALEWIRPGRPPTPIDGFLRRFGPGLHHVALRVQEPLVALREELVAAGLDAGAVEPSSDGRPSLFIHPRSTGGVLVELVEGEPR